MTVTAGRDVSSAVGTSLYVVTYSGLVSGRGAEASDESPYPGLAAFGTDQAQWFFGRERFTGELLSHLDEMIRSPSTGPLLLVGAPGAGKSSLLRAGLLPALDRASLPARGSASWPRLLMTPGPDPASSLSRVLETLSGAEAGRAQAGSGDSRAIVVIDGLEEIFTVVELEAERRKFLDELEILGARGDALVVLALRADFYARAATYPVLLQAMQSRQVVLGPMSADELRLAIIGPARAAGLTVEPGFVELLLRDLGVGNPYGDEPGRLPLLAHALRETWQRRDGHLLTVAGYEATGGIAGAIARAAERAYSTLDTTGQAEARRLFLGLVRVGGTTSDRRGWADNPQRASVDSLFLGAADPAAARAVLDAFISARLLTAGYQAVELTHEALLYHWPRLQHWVEEYRSSMLIRQEIEDAARAWAVKGQDRDYLLRGARLALAEAEAGGPAVPVPLSPQGLAFLRASEHNSRRGARMRVTVTTLLIALLVALAVLLTLVLS